MRVFIAIPLPVDIRASLASLCHGIAGAKWTQPENMHITLRFLGELNDEQCRDLDDELSEINCPRFDLTFRSFGCFDKRGHVHTLWAALDKSPELERLFEKVESASVRAGLEKARRKFKPHTTLARFRHVEDREIGTFMESRNPYSSEPFPAQSFVMYQSLRGNEGPRYEVLAEYPLISYSE